MMAIIKLAQPREWMPKISALMRENWDETGFGFEFNPAIEMYQSAVDAGLIFALGAVTDSGEMVGYCTMMVTPHWHNPAVIIASNDALFVTKEHRGITSARLIAEAEKEAKRRGASRVLWHTRAGTGLAEMLRRRGYEDAEVVVMKGI